MGHTADSSGDGPTRPALEGERLVAYVHGRVQGVGFRYFVQHAAVGAGLAGYTRNLSDGRTVEVVAEGTRPALDQLLAVLRQGPPGSYVERVETSWEPPAGTFSGFSIHH